MRNLYLLFFCLSAAAAGAQAPTTAPMAPTRPAGEVISIYSDTYEDTGIDTYDAEFTVGTQSEMTFDGNSVLVYEGLGYAGIEMIGENALDLEAANITTLHFDYYSPNVNLFLFKLVDFGAGGTYEPQTDNTESEVGRALPKGEWVGVDLPIGLFTDMNYTNISQLIVSTVPNTEATVYLDNIYFYSGGETIGATPLDLPVTFEDETTTYGLSDFGGAVSQIVVDPTDADNTVAQTTKIANAETFAGTTLTLDKGGSPRDPGFATPLNFTDENTIVTVRVWSPTAGTPVRLKVENSGDPTVSVETQTNTTVAMEWETLSFDFANEADGTAALNLDAVYDKMSIFFDFGTRPTADATYYWDDVIFAGGTTGGGGGGNEPMAPEMAAPTPTMSADSVLSLFSDAYDDVDVDTWRTEWSKAQYMESSVDGNAVKVYSLLDYVGIEMMGEAAIDITNYDFFHVDFWSANMDSLRVKLVDFGNDGPGEGNDTEFELTYFVQPNTWNSLDIPISDFQGINTDDISQLIFAGLPTGTGTVYIDNVYFYQAATTAVREPIVGTLGAFPNPVADRVRITAPSRMESLVVYDAAGRQVAEYRPGTEQFALPMGQLRTGMYLAIATTAEGRMLVKLRKQ
ncbi:T9SS type A sorting domain-containing protein [Lewinella sp. IMCC34183]|uniref:T9SS type A sorting domain-containing protein n=1 Tax=Lewinella sp. IMCC34183 TaxID=2248762 RepID=UPI000E242044|nr:T9SS type A sorting domain-containing protein [Lewinella sp. IMCC34183]